MLKDKKLFLFDMDGTIYHEECLIEGSLELFDKLKKQNKEFIFLTNNSSKSVEVYIEKLKRLGIEVDKKNFFTSSQVTILYLKEKKFNNNIYVVGTEAFKKEIKESGLQLLDEDSEEKIETLVVGFDTELNYSKLTKASLILFEEVNYIATNPDLACPIKGNKFIPDCGAICELLYKVTNKKPFYVGKPRKEMIEILMQEKGYRKEEVVVIGDRLYTDIACGLNANVTSILVLTGETDIKMLEKSEIKPTLVFKSIKEIIKNI